MTQRHYFMGHLEVPRQCAANKSAGTSNENPHPDLLEPRKNPVNTDKGADRSQYEQIAEQYSADNV